MEKTPYAIDFLWHQIELGFNEIRKSRYKKLLEAYLFDEEIRKKLEEKKDYKGRNYKGGMLETTASLVSLALCTYDNYPEIDIDLILTAILMNGICSIFNKKECYDRLKDYPEIIPFLFKKQRKKPSLEVSIFDQLVKFDNKIIAKILKKRKQAIEAGGKNGKSTV